MASQKKIIFGSDQIIDINTTQQDLFTLLLKNRDIKKEDLAEFLDPTHPDHLNADKFGIWLVELSKAVARIRQAIEKQENILIYGDYDVDGITSTAILWQALNKSKALVTPFVPDRENDGYGFKYDSFIRFQTEKNIKFNLLITVDNGIVATKELEKVKADGLEIIIVDHHLADENSHPPAFAIVHSTQVSGSILSWILASKFYKDADLGLAALGAVADCVPLLGVNRNIVFHGLKKLQENPGQGMKKLMEISGSKQETLSTYDLGFILGPRINAVGRLSNPTEALRLLCAPTPELATRYAKTLDDYNKDRQVLQKECIDAAENQFIACRDARSCDSTDNPTKLLFVSHLDFHPGIIGLIAGRLTEKYYLPSIAISLGSEVSKGSCRSIKEINIIETLREFSHLLVDVGGHAGAAGFSILNENIPEFQKLITEFVNQKLKDIELSPSYFVDAQALLSAVTIKNYKVIKKLEPFGLENTEPFFLFKDVVITQKKAVGQTGDHLKLKFDNVDAIAFKKGDMDSILNIGDKVDIIARIDSNTWNNITTPQLIVKEIIINQ